MMCIDKRSGVRMICMDRRWHSMPDVVWHSVPDVANFNEKSELAVPGSLQHLTVGYNWKWQCHRGKSMRHDL